MNVFLAGKVDERFGSWRDSILGTGLTRNMDIALRHCFDQFEYYQHSWARVPRWAKFIPASDITQGINEGENWLQPWAPEPDIVLGIHTYTGPFQQVEMPRLEPKYTGYFHGVTTGGCHGSPEDRDRSRITRCCCEAIQKSDLVFAFINSPDAYGTVAEIGYAAALGKFVAVFVTAETPFDYEDFWYVGHLASVCIEPYELRAASPASESELALVAFKEALVKYTAHDPRPTCLPAMVTRDDRSERAIREIARSFQQIARWTSDPRVRGEAQRMLDALGAG